jgi:cell division protein FtsB
MKARFVKLITNIRTKVRHNIARLDLKLSDLLIQGFLLFVIFVLGYNIYMSYNKGLDNLARVGDEQVQLDNLVKEQQRLRELEKYYSSAEFGLAYARDSWNLAEPGAQLYMINRDQVQQVENVKAEVKPIPLADNSLWWSKLILGK